MAQSSYLDLIPIDHYTLVALTLSILVLYLVHSFTLAPLSSIPGPFLSKFSVLPLAIQCRRVRKSQWISELHKKYGPMVRIAPNHVSINIPDAVNQIYGHKAGLLKGPFYKAPFDMVQPNMFSTQNPHIHQRKRKYISPAFSARNLQDFEPHLSEDILILKQQFLQKAKTNETVDLCVWSNYLAFDVISDYCFGRPFGFLSSGKDPENLVRTVDTRSEVLNTLGNLPKWIRPWMKYLRLDPFFYLGMRASANLVSFGVIGYNERMKSSRERKDLMSFLIKAKDPDNNGPLPSEEIISEAISFLVGGSDTVSTTINNIFDFISRDQTLQQELFEELQEAFPGPLDDSWVAPEGVSRTLKLLDAFIKEGMRLRPTSSVGLERIVPAGGKEIQGRYFPAKCLVSVPTLGIHHNPEVFPNPDKFDPHRWLQEDTSVLNELFAPFSVGPRSCVGRNFAWMEMIKTFATLFRLYKFERTTTTPSELREGFFVKVMECQVKIITRQ